MGFFLNILAQKKSIYDAWESVRDKVKLYSGSKAAIDDAYVIARLLNELGAWKVTVSVAVYSGIPHFVVKGNPAFKRAMANPVTITNPKVIAMGVGKSGALKAAKSGGLVSIVLMTMYRVADYALRDEATLTQLVGHLATDIVKIGITVGVSLAAAQFGAMVGATVAIGPLVAVFIAGVGMTYLLDFLDNKYGITDKVIAGLEEISENSSDAINSTIEEVKDSVFDYAVDSARRLIINTANHIIRDAFHQEYKLR